MRPGVTHMTVLHICFFSAIAVILVTLFCAVRARRRLLPVSGVLLAGIFFVDLILLFGTLLGDRTFSYALVKSFAAAIESVKGADPDTVAYPDEALG